MDLKSIFAGIAMPLALGLMLVGYLYGDALGEIAELKSAFENEDIDLYELQDLVDDLYYDFSDKAFKIVEREGFTGVYAEPSTQGGIGDDFFTAYKGDVRYEGQYDYEEEYSSQGNGNGTGWCYGNGDSDRMRREH